MSISRRHFLQTTAPIAGSLLLAKSAILSATPKHPQARLKILILGGTGFIGPHQVRYALSRGHEVTLFNRGITNPGMFPQLETLIGDRNDNLEALRGREWDVVIDNSATRPPWVTRSTEMLRDSVQRYVYVSSTGVFFPYQTTEIPEDGPTTPPLENPNTQIRDALTYGAAKAMSEEITRAAFPDGHLVIRPTYIVGPGDLSDRFTYWTVRIDRGGEVLAPGHPDDATQYIDVRDLAKFMISSVEREVGGTFNLVGQRDKLSISELLYGIRAVTTSSVRFTWVESEFLASNGLLEFTFWEPPLGDTLGMMRIDGAKAFAHGLTVRPLAETAKDTLDWFKTLPFERRANLRSGLSPEREMELLEMWKGR